MVPGLILVVLDLTVMTVWRQTASFWGRCKLSSCIFHILYLLYSQVLSNIRQGNVLLNTSEIFQSISPAGYIKPEVCQIYVTSG
jgi:hypothetical protein